MPLIYVKMIKVTLKGIRLGKRDVIRTINFPKLSKVTF